MSNNQIINLEIQIRTLKLEIKRLQLKIKQIEYNTNIDNLININCEISKKRKIYEIENQYYNKKYIENINDFINNIKLKKKKCLNYLNNNCIFNSETCKFSHIELKINECKYMNLCKNINCTRNHYLYKYEYCTNDLLYGYCNNNNCIYYHISNEIKDWIQHNNICINGIIYRYCNIQYCNKIHSIK
jgi:hypothetical protein